MESLPCHCPWVCYRLMPGQDGEHIWLRLAKSPVPVPTISSLQEYAPHLIPTMFREPIMASLLGIINNNQDGEHIHIQNLYKAYRDPKTDWIPEMRNFITRAFDYFWFQQSGVDMGQLTLLSQYMPLLGLKIRKLLRESEKIIRDQVSKIAFTVIPMHTVGHQRISDYFLYYVTGEVTLPTAILSKEDADELPLWPACKIIAQQLQDDYTKHCDVLIPLPKLAPEYQLLVKHGVLVPTDHGTYHLYSFIHDLLRFETFVGDLCQRSQPDILSPNADSDPVTTWDTLVSYYCSNYELVIINTCAGEHAIVEQLAGYCSAVFYPNSKRDYMSTQKLPIWLVRDAHLWNLREFLLRIIVPFMNQASDMAPRLVIALDLEAATTIPTVLRMNNTATKRICPKIGESNNNGGGGVEAGSKYAPWVQRMLGLVRKHLADTPWLKPLMQNWVELSSNGFMQPLISGNASDTSHIFPTSDQDNWMSQLLAQHRADVEFPFPSKRILLPGDLSYMLLGYSDTPCLQNETTLRRFYTMLLCSHRGLVMAS